MADSAALLDDLIETGAELQVALIRLLSPVDAEFRAMTLARGLGLDKSIASKAARCAKLSDPAGVLLDAPSPAGLRMIAEAAAQTDAPADNVARLTDVADRLDVLIDGFPGGRQALETALAFRVPERRKASDLRARRSVLSAMARLTGFELDCFYVAYWYVPGSTGDDRADNAWAGWTHGFRRHGNTSRLLVGGVNSTKGDTRAMGRLSIAGEPIGDDPSRLLIPEFTTAPTESLGLTRGDRMVGLVLDGSTPAIGDSVNIAQGSWSPGGAPLHATDEKPYEYFRITARRPTRVLVGDMIVHKDVYPDAEPIIESRTSGSPFPISPLGPSVSEFDRIDQAYELTRLDPVRRGLHCAEAPRADELLAHVHAARGWDVSDLRVWRLRIECPLPMVETLFWIRLPER